jgi:hypothetical protein
VRLTVEIDGVQVPLDECDWVLRAPCGCVRQVMHAVCGRQTFADPGSVWDEFYSWEAGRKRDRDRLIRKAINSGRTVRLMTIGDAVDALMKVCLHKAAKGGGSRG